MRQREQYRTLNSRKLRRSERFDVAAVDLVERPRRSGTLKASSIYKPLCIDTESPGDGLDHAGGSLTGSRFDVADGPGADLSQAGQIGL